MMYPMPKYMGATSTTINAPVRSIGSASTTAKTSLLTEAKGTVALSRGPQITDGRRPQTTHRSMSDIVCVVIFARQSDYGAIRSGLPNSVAVHVATRV